MAKKTPEVVEPVQALPEPIPEPKTAPAPVPEPIVETIPITESVKQPESVPVIETVIIEPEQLLGDLAPTPETIVETDEKRGRGRPQGAKDKEPRKKQKSDSVIPEAQPVQVNQADYQLMSEMLFDSGTNSLAVLFGPEWQARDPNERSAVCNALVAYLKAKQVQDIPPGMMLTIVLIAYSAPRMRAPSTAGKLKAGWFWLRNKFGKKKVQQTLPL